MKTVFITGAEGFAGKHLSEFLKQRGYDVVGGVRNRARKMAFEKQYGKAVVCEVSDAINVARAVASVRPDAVVHLAGPSQNSSLDDDPLAGYQSIVTAWANVLDGVRRSVPRSKVVLVSSWEVYGADCGGQPWSEQSPCRPANALGSFKANAEAVADTYFRNYHLNYSIARPFAYTGSGQGERSFWGDLARQTWNAAAAGGSLSVPNLPGKWDLLHVGDVVEAYWRLIEDGKPNETYNICSGKTVSTQELSSALARCTGRNISFQSAGSSSTTCWGGNDKLRQLGWQPTRSVESAIADLARSCAPQTATTTVAA
ncbi:MAG: GDP-mannose 4,6-dehydratase [Planctomycetes bacterium]|nr:GDP-mannose 4,6-dehydratase [Planctomycetota bacterium]